MSYSGSHHVEFYCFFVHTLTHMPTPTYLHTYKDSGSPVSEPGLIPVHALDVNCGCSQICALRVHWALPDLSLDALWTLICLWMEQGKWWVGNRSRQEQLRCEEPLRSCRRPGTAVCWTPSWPAGAQEPVLLGWPAAAMELLKAFTWRHLLSVGHTPQKQLTFAAMWALHVFVSRNSCI